MDFKRIKEIANDPNTNYIEMFPNLSKFVKCRIVPSELEGLTEVTAIYVKRLLEHMIESNIDGLDYLIYISSPFPGWADHGGSDFMNHGTDQITNEQIIQALKKAFKKDKIKCNIPDRDGLSEHKKE